MRVIFRARNVVGASRSPFSGTVQTFLWPGEWWEAEVTLPPLKRADAEVWITFLLSLRGQAGSFLLWDPSAKSPLTDGTWPPGGAGFIAQGTSVAGNTTIETSFFGASGAVNIEPGSYFQVGPIAGDNWPRLHKILTVPETADSFGNALMDIFPALRFTPPAGTSLITTNPQGTFMLAENQTQWDVDAAMTYGISFKAVEDLRNL
ncbi:MAG TPA: hypothetical protein VG206_02895 [Terriglobia bacterium]|nr:hypothetical protein [Terriglobia bacterium]